MVKTRRDQAPLRVRRAGAAFVALAGLALAVAGCSPRTPVDRAQSEYEGGDFQDAVDRLEGAELSYANGELGPEYELKYLAYRGLAFYRLAEETGNKGFRRKGRPFVRRAMDRWNTMPEAKAGGWLDPAIVAELEEATKDAEGARAANGDDGATGSSDAAKP